MNPYDAYHFENGIKMKNRLVMAPMTTYSGNTDLTVSEEELDYYRVRSTSLGMVITSATSINENAQAFINQITLKHDDYIPSMSRLADVIQEGGALAVVQLHHGGRMNDPSLYADKTMIVSASPVPALRDKAVTPRALREDEVQSIIQDFAAATKRAILAGFDGVELHGANTYLLQQFFSPHSNRRNDRYGGSLSKRMTFVSELIDACKAEIDVHATRPFLLGYRFSPEELETPGITLSDTRAFIAFLKAKPLDFLHISLSRYDQSSKRDTKDNTPIAEHIQSALLGALPLIGVGGIETSVEVKEALSMGYDLVASGMAILADPLWGIHVSSGVMPTKLVDSATMPKLLFERLKRNEKYFAERGYHFKT